MRYRWLFCLIFFICQPGFALDECTGPHRGQTLTRSRVVQLLKSEKSPLNLCGTTLAKVNLANLDLTGVNLSFADLSHADLANTRLNDADLQKAYLRWAKLTGTVFFQANLSAANLQESEGVGVDFRQANLNHVDLNGAHLEKAKCTGAKLMNAFMVNVDFQNAEFAWANLSDAEFEQSNAMNASFERANLRGTHFTGSNLTNAEFQEADLTGAELRDVLLQDARFYDADLQDVLYQPKINQLPDLLLLVHAKHFNKIRFHYQKGLPALAQLRTAYEELNVRTMERMITSMIKIKQMNAGFDAGGSSQFEALMQYVLFYIPSEYGASPGRPLKIFLFLLLFCCIPYTYAITHPSRTSGLLIKWSAQSFPSSGKMHHRRLSVKRPHAVYHPVRDNLRIIRIAFHFSLLSAFQIGWREWNVSNWISRVQGREYFLLSFGWVRVVAGIQSILSAYLLVLWAVTYFGRPFEW